MKKALVVLGLALFCTVVSQNAWAASNIGFKRLGVDVGMVDPEAAGSTIGFGARADLGTISPDIHLSTHVNYWNKSENQFGVEAGLRDISVGARATYNFHMSSGKVQPYVGGGPGVHFFNVKVDVPFSPGMTVSESETKIGFDLGGGASMPISPKAQAFSELYYTVCDIDQFAFKAGVSFALGGPAASMSRTPHSTRGR
jgi:opacity protein-like surface antigen